jgi:hypothetical protein
MSPLWRLLSWRVDFRGPLPDGLTPWSGTSACCLRPVVAGLPPAGEVRCTGCGHRQPWVAERLGTGPW